MCTQTVSTKSEYNGNFITFRQNYEIEMFVLCVIIFLIVNFKIIIIILKNR